MSKIVYIAEKPNVGKVMAEYLWGADAAKYKDRSSNSLYRGKVGKDEVVVTWAQGHILQDATPEQYSDKFIDRFAYPVMPGLDSWKLVPSPQTKHLLKTIKMEISDADIVVNGGDPDREGQLLVDEILEYLKYKGKSQRILIDGWDEKNVDRAFKSIDDNNKPEHRNMYKAGLARKMADWLVGMNFCRAYSAAARKAGCYEYLNVGRVKSWILGMLVRREREIADFRPKKYFILKANYTKNGIPFSAEYVPDDSVTDEEGRILEPQLPWLKALAARLSGQDSVIRKVTKKTGQKLNPPLPYSLDTLQVDGSRSFGFSPQHVLDIAQQLYELKLLTYPRSDCQYIPVSQFEDAEDILPVLESFGISQASGADTSLKSKAFNDKKITAHHAIIPTSVTPPSNLNDDQKKLYTMVAKRYIQQFYPSLVYDAVNFEVLAGGDSLFKGSGTKVTDYGWKKAFKKEAEISEDGDESSPSGSAELPDINEGDVISSSDSGYDIEDGVTKPPSRFKEDTIIKAMTNVYKYVPKDATIKMGSIEQPLAEVLKECNGIGTPATRGSILEDLKKDYVLYEKDGKKMKRPKPAYVVVQKKFLVPTEFGTQLVDSLTPSVLDTAMTARMEFNLKRIADGDYSLEEYISKILDFVHDGIAYAEEHRSCMKPIGNRAGIVSDVVCPVCGKGKLRLAHFKSGMEAWICSDKDCLDKNGFIMYWGNGDKPVIEKCPECGRILHAIRTKSGTDKWVCSHGKELKDEGTLWMDSVDGRPVKHEEHKADIVVSDVDCPVCGKAKLRLAKLKSGAKAWICSDKACLDKNGFVMYWGTDKKPHIEKCPECGRILRAIQTRSGAEKWCCSHGKELNDPGTLWLDSSKGKPVKAKTAKCPVCGGAMRQVKTNAGKLKWVCDHGKKGDALWLDDVGGKPAKVVFCPECKRPLRSYTSKKTGKSGYLCDHGVKDGPLSFFDEDGKPVVYNKKS